MKRLLKLKSFMNITGILPEKQQVKLLRHRKISERMDIKMKNNKRYFISYK